MIEYRKGSLFDAPAGAILTHACNAKGEWGSGIAWEFRNKFPNEYAIYHDACAAEKNPRDTVGKCIMAGRVACLVTSLGYGKEVDGELSILQATETSFYDLLRSVDPDVEIHMPRINSGLFRVPWHRTEEALKGVLRLYPGRKVIVWEL